MRVECRFRLTLSTYQDVWPIDTLLLIYRMPPKSLQIKSYVCFKLGLICHHLSFFHLSIKTSVISFMYSTSYPLSIHLVLVLIYSSRAHWFQTHMHIVYSFSLFLIEKTRGWTGLREIEHINSRDDFKMKGEEETVNRKGRVGRFNFF